MNRNDFPTEECYNPDEIIVQDIEMFHAEVMEKGKSLWIGITRKNGQIDHLNICVKGKKLSTLWSPNIGNMNPSETPDTYQSVPQDPTDPDGVL